MADNELSATVASTSATVETTAAPSMDDTIRSTLADIKSRSTDESLSTADAGVPATAGKPAAGRDATGKFAKASAASGTPADDAANPASTGDPEQVAATAADPSIAEAPKSWRGEAKAQWAAVPDGIKAEIHKREQDMFRGIEQYKGEAGHFRNLDAVIRPHAEIIKQSGQNAIENIGGLLDFQRTLYTGNDSQKITTLLQIAQNVGIKPEVLLEGLQNPPQQPAHDPRYDSLSRQLEETRQMLGDVQMRPILAQVEQFVSDPANEFVSDPQVQASMGRLLESGEAQNMKQAYDKACLLSDSVRGKLDARKRDEDAKRKADLAAKAARASSINVRTRGSTAPGQAAKGTMDDTIRARLAELKAEGRA